ncbi:MAG: hypothetical protein U1E46_01495 [Hyphomicrobiales bacterium]
MKAILYGISIALIAAGVAVGLMVLTSAGNVVIGLTLDTAATLLSGGFIVLGLASVTQALFSVVDAIEAARGTRLPLPQTRTNGDATAVALGAGAAAGAAAYGASKEPFPRMRDEAATEQVARAEPEVEPPEPAAEAIAVAEETIVAAPAEHVAEVVEEALEGTAESPAEEAAAETGFEEVLYVVEEKIVRGKPARFLSDGTVEAETDEGWMRFENLEHLEEYLDATEAA